MKTRLHKLHKKGAIEMSMQTIIVVVIGVTLLTLGLKFVYDTFSGIGSQQQEISEVTGKKIGELFGESDAPIYLSKGTVDIKIGKSTQVNAAIRNTDAADTKAGLGVSGDEKAITWITYAKAKTTLRSGQAKEYIVDITVPKTAKIGTYLVSFEVVCEGSDSLICGESQDMIIKVIA